MPTRRIPHLGHVLLFLVITFIAYLLSAGAAMLIFGARPTGDTLERLQLFAQALTYAATLAASYVIFPAFWNRPFLTAIDWNPTAVRPILALIGLAIGFAAQGVEIYLPHPKDLPVEAIFRNHALIWSLVFFATILGPLFEEVLFRGLLLPAIAIAVDFIRLPRPADPIEATITLDTWRTSTTFSTPALIISSILTSLCFASIHAPQLGFSWASVAALAVVSLILCYIRIRTRSVAASTLVHAFYNLSVFITLFIGTGAFRHLDRAG
jgi:uncharacterized protein